MGLEDNDFTKPWNSSPWNKSDVIFSVDGRQLFFNRCVLVHHSKVFEAMFTHKFRDPETAIPLEGKFEDVQAMLFVLVPTPTRNFFSCNPITKENVWSLKKMADAYGIRRLASECQKFIYAAEELADAINPPQLQPVMQNLETLQL